MPPEYAVLRDVLDHLLRIRQASGPENTEGPRARREGPFDIFLTPCTFSKGAQALPRKMEVAVSHEVINT